VAQKRFKRKLSEDILVVTGKLDKCVTCGSEEIQEKTKKTKKEAARSHRNTKWVCDLCLREN
jgi:hypothetical protein